MLVEAELSNPLYELTSGDCDAGEKARQHNCIATKGVGRSGPAKWKDAKCVNEQLEGIMMVSSVSLLLFKSLYHASNDS